jgi:hypothetical protein
MFDLAGLPIADRLNGLDAALAAENDQTLFSDINIGVQ